MRVREIMYPYPSVCSPHDSLNHAARLMWEANVAFVPVVDHEGVLVGVLADRDICMAAYTRGQRLADIAVAAAMSRSVVACSLDAPIEDAEEIMRLHHVRRLPVIDHGERLVGIISLNDLALETSAHDVVKTLASVGPPPSRRRSA